MSFTISGNKVSGPVPTYTPIGGTTAVPHQTVSICSLSKASYVQNIKITFTNPQAPSDPVILFTSNGSTQSVATPMHYGDNTGTYENTWITQTIPAGTTSIDIEFTSSSATTAAVQAMPSTPMDFGAAVTGIPVTTLYGWNSEDSNKAIDLDELDSQVFMLFN